MAGLFSKEGGTGSGEIPITDAGIIATITTPANWTNGLWTGVLPAGLVAGSTYYDSDWKQRYHYDGTTLRRSTYNELRD